VTNGRLYIFKQTTIDITIFKLRILNSRKQIWMLPHYLLTNIDMHVCLQYKTSEGINNKHLCSIELGSIKCNLETVKVVRKRGNYCRDTAKIGIRTPYFRFVTEPIVD